MAQGEEAGFAVGVHLRARVLLGLLALSPGTAEAGDATGEDTMPVLYQVLFFSTSDVGTDARYSKLGVRYAPMGSIDTSGPVVTATFATGTYRYVKKRRFVRGVAAGLELAAGYQIQRPRFGIAAVAGPVADYRALINFDPGNRNVGFQPAAIVALDGWAKPFPNVLATGYARIESRRGGWYVKGFAGYEIRQELFLGPEGALMQDGDYAEHLYGVSVVGLPARSFRAKVTAGLGANSDDRSTRFLSVALWRRF